MKKVSNEELAEILEKHGRWLRGEKGGAWADLSGVDLRWADLAGADIREATMTGVKR